MRFPIHSHPAVVAAIPLEDRPKRIIRMSVDTFEAHRDLQHADGRPSLHPVGTPGGIRTVVGVVPFGYFDLEDVR